MMISPEEMEIGRTYRLDYIPKINQICRFVGEYTGMEIMDGVLYFWFYTRVGCINLQYATMHHIRDFFEDTES